VGGVLTVIYSLAGLVDAVRAPLPEH